MTKERKHTEPQPWTKARLAEALKLLNKGMSLTAAAKHIGVTRMALSNALRRHGVMPVKKWVSP
jgi:lambda repressor-like predicted transcriptional regulator